VKRLLPVAAILGSAYACLHWLGRTWGATPLERKRALPGDEIVHRPMVRTTHAITVAVPPEEVWPWLVQMGYHRGGWYTYPWVDRVVFSMTNPSADHIVDELQHLAVGDVVPDGPPGTAWYDVVALEAPHHLVLHSTTHVPAALRSAAERRRWAAEPWVDWSWSFVLEPCPTGTRLLLRMRGRCGPWWLRALFVGAIVPADFVMARSMLRGIRSRAEHRLPH
jgi:hypothetical protein